MLGRAGFIAILKRMTEESRLPLNNIRIVLSGPIYGGNVGSVCRAMANMGLSDLVIAGDSAWEPREAHRMACWAQDVLETRRETRTLAEALSDCSTVFGATARCGLYRSHARTPREAAPAIIEAALNGKVAILFGPEDNGLSNENLELCSRLIHIPSSEKYPSLNLSHAVMVCAYEIFTAYGCFEPVLEKSPDADSSTKERMFEMWEQTLLKTGFMEEDKARHMMLGVRRIFSRGRLTEDDVRILMGIARQARWCAESAQSKSEISMEHNK